MDNEKISIRKKRSKFVNSLPLTLLALPGVAMVFLFHYVPLYGLILPFKNYDYSLGFWRSPWIGFKNFEYLFVGRGVLIATRNTILYNFAFIVLGLVCSVLLALMLFEMQKRAVKTYQTIIFLPYFISWVVAAYVLRSLLDMENGMLNNLLAIFGKNPVMWYNDARYWPPIIVLIYLWKHVGYNIVIFYAALMGIDRELYEAARIDGAGKLKQVINISIPMLKPMITMIFLLNVGKILYGDFGLFYNTTMDSSLLYSTTDVIDTFVYRALTSLGDLGMSAAAGFLQSVLGFTIVISANALTRKVDKENALF